MTGKRKHGCFHLHLHRTHSLQWCQSVLWISYADEYGHLSFRCLTGSSDSGLFHFLRAGCPLWDRFLWLMALVDPCSNGQSSQNLNLFWQFNPKLFFLLSRLILDLWHRFGHQRSPPSKQKNNLLFYNSPLEKYSWYLIGWFCRSLETSVCSWAWYRESGEIVENLITRGSGVSHMVGDKMTF